MNKDALIRGSLLTLTLLFLIMCQAKTGVSASSNGERIDSSLPSARVWKNRKTIFSEGDEARHRGKIYGKTISDTMLDTKMPIDISGQAPGYPKIENQSGDSSRRQPTSSSSGYTGGLSSSVPSLSDGGGIGGAIARLAGLIPMLGSKISEQLGRIRRRRRRDAEAKPDAAVPFIQQHHLDTIENLNRYYSSLANNTNGHRPTPEEVKMHRKYLLNLLQELRRSQGKSTLNDNSTPSQKVKPPSDLSSDGNKSDVNKTTANRNDSQSGTQLAKRMGETPSKSADIQNLGAGEAALLLHQFQTQGNVNILPPNFLDQPLVSSQFQQNTKKPNQATDDLQQISNKMRAEPTSDVSRGSVYHDPSSQISQQSQHSSFGMPWNSDYQEVYEYDTADEGPSSNVNQQFSSRFGQAQVGFSGGSLGQSSNSQAKSILDKFPDQSALLNPQNIPDLLEGLKLIEVPDTNAQSPSLEEIVQSLPLEFFLNSNIYQDYESLINAIRIMQQHNNFQSNINSATSQPQNLIDLTLPDSPVTSNANQIYNPNYNHQTGELLRPQVFPTRGSQIANTRLTAEVNTAFENLVDNITKAITTFLTDLAAAITETPALLLLGLIPFAFLIFSLYHHYGAPIKGHGNMGYGGGQSSYGRISFDPRRPYNEAEFLARRILANIDDFEKWADTEFSQKE